MIGRNVVAPPAAPLNAAEGGGGGDPNPNFGTLLPARLPESSGTNYYVAPAGSGGSDSNDGSIGSPWLTIQKAFDTVGLVGSIINLRAGSYTSGTNYSQWTRAGNSANPVTIQNYPGEVAVVDQQRLLVSGSYLRIRGLEIQDVPVGQENGIKLDTGADHVEVVGCYIHDCSRTGIMVVAGDNLQIWDCIIENNGTSGTNQDHGIYWSASSGTANSDCVVANCLIYLSSGYNIQHYSNPQGVIYTCVTVDDCKQPLATGGRGGVVVGSDSGTTCSDNVFVGIISRGAPSEGFDRYNPAGTYSGNEVYDSICFDNDGGDFGTGSGITYTNCTTVDPDHVNAASRDYHLSPGSPAIDHIDAAREGYIPQYDIEGTVRVTRDAGCYAA